LIEQEMKKEEWLGTLLHALVKNQKSLGESTQHIFRGYIQRNWDLMLFFLSSLNQLVQEDAD